MDNTMHIAFKAKVVNSLKCIKMWLLALLVVGPNQLQLKTIMLRPVVKGPARQPGQPKSFVALFVRGVGSVHPPQLNRTSLGSSVEAR